ncbi:MAG TPA: hypothetical protein VFR58_08285 [Flavisolibacter sp.]|nr:hypothetical protein [Flavisolibacter sp.]
MKYTNSRMAEKGKQEVYPMNSVVKSVQEPASLSNRADGHKHAIRRPEDSSFIGRRFSFDDNGGGYQGL